MPAAGWQPWFGKAPCPAVQKLDELAPVGEDAEASEEPVADEVPPSSSSSSSRKHEFLDCRSILEVVDAPRDEGGGALAEAAPLVQVVGSGESFATGIGKEKS